MGFETTNIDVADSPSQFPVFDCSLKYISFGIKDQLAKELVWLGSSRRDLMKFPKDVMQEVGYALYHAQLGERYRKAKPFKGCGPGVYEIATEYAKNAYRAIYILSLSDKVYVVHCFQKKSKQGIKTPREEIEVIKQRLKFLSSQ